MSTAVRNRQKSRRRPAGVEGRFFLYEVFIDINGRLWIIITNLAEDDQIIGRRNDPFGRNNRLI
jgi:hypothetical protein